VRWVQCVGLHIPVTLSAVWWKIARTVKTWKMGEEEKWSRERPQSAESGR
jgi:hypothetical protein